MKRSTIIIIVLFAVCYVLFLTCVAIESRNVLPMTYITVSDTTDVDYTSVPLSDSQTLRFGINNEKQRIFGGLTGELRIVASDTVDHNRLVVPQQLKPYFAETFDGQTSAIVIGDSVNSPIVINCSIPITVYLKQLPSNIESYLTSPLLIDGGTTDSLRIMTARSLVLSALTARKITVNSRYRYYNGEGSCRANLNAAAVIDTLCIGDQFHNATVTTDSTSLIRNLVMLTPGKTALSVNPESNIDNFSFPSGDGEKSLIIKSTESFEFYNKNK